MGFILLPMQHRLSNGRRLGWIAFLTSVYLMAGTLTRTQLASSVWDGAYAEAQATAGQAVYSQACAECHGEDLAGREQAPALVGLGFMDNWNRATLRQLYDTLADMPPDQPRSLEPRQYIDVLAYLLSANEFPAGTAALTTDRAALARIRILSVRPQE